MKRLFAEATRMIEIGRSLSLVESIIDAIHRGESPIDAIARGLPKPPPTDETPATVLAGSNPLLDAFKLLADKNSLAHYGARRKFVDQYSWAIPNDAALNAIAKHSPIIEIGAGMGYWASLLRAIDVDILAYDRDPPKPGSKNNWHQNAAEREPWTKVLRGSPSDAARHPERALFLCWPPLGLTMAVNCLRRYRGETVLYIGEEQGGCTGSDAFFQTLSRRFDLSETIEIPQWSGIHDCLQIWKRKSRRRRLTSGG